MVFTAANKLSLIKINKVFVLTYLRAVQLRVVR